MSGTLYIVATPIGNLEDISLRAIRILSEVDTILAEDTRVTKKLLSFLSDPNFQFPISNFQLTNTSVHQTPSTIHNPPIKVRLLSYHQHSDERRALEVFNMLESGKDIALVTDAGTPGISDPGNELISYLLSLKSDLNVVSVPGASAVTSALSICGFNVSKFTFVGFVPKKKGKKILAQSLSLGIPVVFFESPYRIFKTLQTLSSLPTPPARVFIAQELTKMHERGIRGTILEVTKILEEEEKKLGRVKGEIVVILEPGK
jgi:16S rRNA (cytidine1402-2'-O)-methyltransferase